MDGLAPAELIPGRYRAILDGIAELERRGLRREAGAIRVEATRAYSRAWDAKALKRLDALLRDIARLSGSGSETPRSSSGLTLSRRTNASS